MPSDLPPLGTLRFPDNTFKASLRVTPGNTMSMQTQLSNNTGARIDVVGGQPVIFIGDRMFALPAVNPSSTTTFGGSAAMDPASKPSSDPPALSSHGSVSGLSFAPPRASSTSPFTGLDLPTLKAQQALKKQELRTVEQTEVLQASHQNDAWRAGMIEKKRCLIVELDALRKSISALEDENTSSTQSASFLGPIGTMPSSTPLPPYVPPVPQSITQPMYNFQANGFTTPMIYPPPYGAFSGFAPAEPAPFIAPQVNSAHSPGSASRRSHAIEIKPPQEGTSKQTLNPKSPTYEPATKSDATRNAARPTPSPPKKSPWRMQDAPQSNGVHRALSQKLSFSSVDTTDFFPTNTHEHSSTRLAPRTMEAAPTAKDQAPVPSTPEKYWPASPWNEGNSSRSKKNEPTSKLTSWPEAFGKQHSSSSLRHNATVQSSDATQQSAPLIGAYGPGHAASKHTAPRGDTSQRSGTQEGWLFSSKATVHVPTTYQEGYQAGYDHVGMPDSPEVLQGYIQGLLQFLADEPKKGRFDIAVRDYIRGHDSRTPSLRDLIAGSMPHDSAVSMAFNSNTGLPANRENARSTKDALLPSQHRDNIHGTSKSAKDVHEAPTNPTYAPRERHVSSAQYTATASLFPDKMMSGRPLGFSSAEDERAKSMRDKDSSVQADQISIDDSFARQFSGIQLQNRSYGTSLYNQRFYPTPKEISPGGYRGGEASTLRPLAGHRMSGLDGAMDDLTGLVMETNAINNGPATDRFSTEVPAAVEIEAEEATASCFKAKGKQKAPVSPTKSSSNGRDNGVSSPNPPSSPKKSGEHSPAKAKLEHVTNKFRRNKKDDPRTMSPEDKVKRSEKWRSRFQSLKKAELEEIEAHRRNSRN